MLYLENDIFFICVVFLLASSNKCTRHRYVYDLDVVFKTSTCFLSPYRTFISMTNAPVTSFSGSSNVVTSLPELLSE